MTLHVVCLYNSYLDVYETPTFHNLPTKEDVVELFRRSVLSDPKGAYNAHAQEKEICLLGTFDDKTGAFDLFERPLRLAGLSQFFPAGYLSKLKEAEDAVFKSIQNA